MAAWCSGFFLQRKCISARCQGPDMFYLAVWGITSGAGYSGNWGLECEVIHLLITPPLIHSTNWLSTLPCIYVPRHLLRIHLIIHASIYIFNHPSTHQYSLSASVPGYMLGTRNMYVNQLKWTSQTVERTNTPVLRGRVLVHHGVLCSHVMQSSPASLCLYIRVNRRVCHCQVEDF